MKLICFRFDVDTHKCGAQGMPRLLDLAKSRGVPFTFFINCGRAICRTASLMARLGLTSQPAANYHPQLSARRKFGNVEFLRCAILNPSVFEYARDHVIRAQRDGHEIGLHGGRNHELWGRYAWQWSEEKIVNEIRWGVSQLKRIGIEAQVFASPCAAGGEKVRKALEEVGGFRFMSDDINPASTMPRAVAACMIHDLPTAVCGTGGVAYIEQAVARGMTKREIVKDFANKVAMLDAPIVYDHPYFAGSEGLSVMEALVDYSLSNGLQVVTISQIGAFYENHLSRKRP